MLTPAGRKSAFSFPQERPITTHTGRDARSQIESRPWK